jgi:outer membrane protein assembly factor BamB
VAAAARRGLLQAIDVSGKVPTRRWAFQMAHEVLGSPVIITDTDPPLLFLGSKYGNLIAIDAATGKEKWQRMVGNWIDNTACIGEINNRKIVFVGSHDYRVYAFDSQTGETLWKTALGGEVFSAPCFFSLNGQPMVAAAALDSHLYIMNASTGEMVNRFVYREPGMG